VIATKGRTLDRPRGTPKKNGALRFQPELTKGGRWGGGVEVVSTGRGDGQKNGKNPERNTEGQTKS